MFAAVSLTFPVLLQKFNKRIIQMRVSVSGIMVILCEKKQNVCMTCLSILHTKRVKFTRSKNKIHTESLLTIISNSPVLHQYHNLLYKVENNDIYFCPCIGCVKLSICLLQWLAQCYTQILLQDYEFTTFFASTEALLLEKNSRWFVFTDGYGDSLG